MSSSYLTDLFSVRDKVAIVTGATGGLGFAMAVGLAKAGARIVSIEIPNDPNSERLLNAIRDVGGESTIFTCDVLNSTSLRLCYSSIWAKGFTPDILVNCAGVMRRNSCENATDEDIDLVSKTSAYINGLLLTPLKAVRY
jgi:2-deoxy-D-gluconate 3-dehydrogenase